MATNLELTHATASAELSPRLSAAEEVVKFIRKRKRVQTTNLNRATASS